MSEFDFQKSTHSSGDAHGECVEVARNMPGTVAIRDSKDLDGPILRLAAEAWVEFAVYVGRG
ncbi:DUF397 domain-containing protein [Streptomyces viridochromogenes]|uniref:DUF397 domain-containing protein n=1 Tax=Streptomyces viridochromogenes TaxID=1938 RepID=UPI00069E52BF|nr:DUF397 domain-containing protein [Streptomyces viridochromogenes]KOG06974.1 hypothetical protein ADK35_44765 [Streptomyces viridochromogenes]KOG12181.1 hypothetical protein ADK36_35835 [Streptomyces viridochromogenes]